MTYNRVTCIYCKRPIHQDHIGVIFSMDGKEAWVCDNTVCLLELSHDEPEMVGGQNNGTK